MIMGMVNNLHHRTISTRQVEPVDTSRKLMIIQLLLQITMTIATSQAQTMIITIQHITRTQIHIVVLIKMPVHMIVLILASMVIHMIVLSMTIHMVVVSIQLNTNTNRINRAGINQQVPPLLIQLQITTTTMTATIIETAVIQMIIIILTQARTSIVKIVVLVITRNNINILTMAIATQIQTVMIMLEALAQEVVVHMLVNMIAIQTIILTILVIILVIILILVIIITLIVAVTI